MKKATYLLIPVLLAGTGCQPVSTARHSTMTVQPAQLQAKLDSTGTDILHGIDSIIKQLPADSTLEFNLGSTEIKP